MNKQTKAGYIMTVDSAIKFYERCQEAEKALGQKLTREEREHLLQSMNVSEELSFEDLCEAMKGKKVLIVKDGNESL